jgi:hypothetical protein
MTVKELIAKLETLPPDLPVRIADRNESWLPPTEFAEDDVFVRESPHGRGQKSAVPFVQIGRD